MLTNREIRLLLKLLSQEVVVPRSDLFRFDVVSTERSGYSADPERARIQSKLSVMLEVNARNGDET